MVLFKEGTYMMDSDYPDTDFTNGNAAYVVPNGSELAMKVQALGVVDFVLTDEGNLIDVVARPTPIVPVEEIKAQLNAVDMASIRPLRAILAGENTQEDMDRLAALEKEAQTLRESLNKIND